MAKEDLRVIKTKNALLEAFFELARERRFEDITVNELCDKADVRRATFYKHFNDKYNFITYMTKCLRAKFDETVWRKESVGSSKDYFIKYFESLLVFLSEEEILINRLLESETVSVLINIIVEQNLIDTKKMLDACVDEGMVLPADSEIVAMMLTGGVTHIITRWLYQGKPISEKKLLSEVRCVIDSLLTPAKN